MVFGFIPEWAVRIPSGMCVQLPRNPHLELNSGFSSLLPCRISVYGSKGRNKLSTVLPSQLAKLFGGAELEPIALEVESAVKAIMEETAK